MQDSTHSIIHSAKRFFGGTMLSRISGMLRDVTMAYAFGTNEAIAAFMVAFRLSHLLRRLLGEGALQTAFIPYFETLRSESPEKARHFFKDLVFTLSSGLFLIIIATMLLLGLCLWTIDFSAGNREIVSLTALMMPSLLFICLFGVNASLLQCEKSYFTPGAAPVAFNALWILGVCAVWSMPADAAMYWLSGFVTLACVGQWLMTVPQTRKIIREQAYKAKWWTSDVRKLGKPLLLGIVGVAASQINNALDAVFARYADPEGPALLWYALRIQQLPLALFGIAISGALLPPLTRSLKTNQLNTYHHFLEFSVRRCVALMLPITATILLMGSTAINLIYGHGDFGNASVVGTTWCLWGYGVGLLPMTLVLILAPAFYARNDYRLPTIASTASMALNIGLNAFFVSVMGAGAAAIALATSISAVANCIILCWGLRQDIHAILTKECYKSICKTMVVTAVASLAVLLHTSDAIEIWLGHDVLFSRNLGAQLWQCGSDAMLFICVLFSLAWVLKAHDFFDLIGQRKYLKASTSSFTL